MIKTLKRLLGRNEHPREYTITDVQKLLTELGMTISPHGTYFAITELEKGAPIGDIASNIAVNTIAQVIISEADVQEMTSNPSMSALMVACKASTAARVIKQHDPALYSSVTPLEMSAVMLGFLDGTLEYAKSIVAIVQEHSTDGHGYLLPLATINMQKFHAIEDMLQNQLGGDVHRD